MMTALNTCACQMIHQYQEPPGLQRTSLVEHTVHWQHYIYLNSITLVLAGNNRKSPKS